MQEEKKLDLRPPKGKNPKLRSSCIKNVNEVQIKKLGKRLQDTGKESKMHNERKQEMKPVDQDP